MVLVGRVTHGSGDLSRWMTLYADAYARAAGAALLPGSLNVVLKEPWTLPLEKLRLDADLVGRIVYLAPCRVGARRCFIFRTERAEQAGGEEHRVLEILSTVRLRTELGVSDGDLVEVVVDDRVGC